MPRFVALSGAATILLAACSHEWDSYDPRLGGATSTTSTSTSTGGSGGSVATGGAGAGGIGGSTPWYDDGLSRRRRLTLTLPTDETLGDFPVLVRVDDTRIDYGVAAPDGSDVRFVADDHATLLAHDVDEWQPAGASAIWLEVPSLAGSATVWMYYGGSPSRAALEPSETWSNDFVAVWHLDDLFDAAGDGNDGVSSGMVDSTTGAIGGAIELGGTEDWVDVGASAAFDTLFVSGATITAWIRPDTPGENNRGRILDRSTDATFGGGWALLMSQAQTPDSVGFGHGFTDQMGYWTTPAGSISYDAWQFVAASFAQARSEPALYVDGAPAGLVADTLPMGAVPATSSLPLRIGGRAGAADRDYDGAIDELRVSSVVRSPAWITAELLSVKDAVVAFGPEEPAP